VLVLPESSVLRGDPALRGDGCGLGEDEREASEGLAPKVNEVELVEEAVDRGEHAHWGEDETVAEGDATQGVRSKEEGWSRGVGGGGCWD